MNKIKIIYFAIMIVCISGLTSCEEEKIGGPEDLKLTESQLAAVSMRGTWGQASDVTLPPGTTEGVLDKLLLRFTITDDYEPADFEGMGEVAMEYLFKPGKGQWKWAAGSTSNIDLIGVQPVSSIQITEQGQTIRLTFTYSGDQGDGGRVSGVGEYGVTLKKIAP